MNKILEYQTQLSENQNISEDDKRKFFYEYMQENKDLFLELEKSLLKFAFIEGSIQRNFNDTNDEIPLAEYWYNCKFLKDEKRSK